MTQHAVKLDNFGNGKTLMMFQAGGLLFLDDAGGNALIADQMGLGKTVEALAYLRHHLR
jgi:SNF2 family DNA or RNA helicase